MSKDSIGGYRGGRPASEVGPPARLPSAYIPGEDVLSPGAIGGPRTIKVKDAQGATIGLAQRVEGDPTRLVIRMFPGVDLGDILDSSIGPCIDRRYLPEVW